MQRKSKQMYGKIKIVNRCFHMWLTYAHRSVLSIGHQQIYVLTLFFANFLICGQELPTFFASSSTDLCHVFLGLPHLLFPAGFQLRACLVISVIGFVRVCPIHCHFFLMMSLTGSCCDLLHNSTLVTLSIHLQ